jgi:hypothetical protein
MNAKKTLLAEEQANLAKQKVNLFLSKYFNLVIIVVVLLILVISFFGLIKPKYNSILNSIQANVYQKEKIYLQQYRKLSESKQLIALFRSISPKEVEKVNSIIPKKYVREDLFSELERLVVGNNFLLKSIEISSNADISSKKRGVANNINNPTLPPEIDQIHVNMSVGGVDYYGLKYLISVLENNLKLMDIVNLEFNPEGNNFNLEFWTYYLKDSTDMETPVEETSVETPVEE